MRQLEQQVATLREEPDRPRLPRHIRPEGDAQLWIQQTHAVRSDQPDARVGRCFAQPVLEGRIVGAACLAEAAGKQLERLYSSRGAIAHKVENVGVRYAGDDVVHAARDVAQRRKGRQSQDLAALRIDRVDPPLVPEFLE